MGSLFHVLIRMLKIDIMNEILKTSCSIVHPPNPYSSYFFFLIQLFVSFLNLPTSYAFCYSKLQLKHCFVELNMISFWFLSDYFSKT